MAVGVIRHSDWLCASCMTVLIGGVLVNQRGVLEGRKTVCTLFFYSPAVGLLHVAQAQNVHTAVELAARGVINATFLPNGSDKRQRSGRIKAVGRWFESRRCVGAFKPIYK